MRLLVAALDIRLLELIETLAAARLDWLAFELIEEIQAGYSPKESEKQLAAARQSIRTNSQPKSHREPHLEAAEPKPIPVDDQIDRAVTYVDRRLGQALEQQLATINSLNFILANTTEQPADENSVSQVADAFEGGVSVILQDVNEDRKIGLENVAAARDEIPALRKALVEWAERARGQAPT